MGRCLGALGWFFGGGTAAPFLLGMPRKSAASFALLMLIVPASGGPPQPQQPNSVAAVMIAIEVIPMLLLFMPQYLSAGQKAYSATTQDAVGSDGEALRVSSL